MAIPFIETYELLTLLFKKRSTLPAEEIPETIIFCRPAFQKL